MDSEMPARIWANQEVFIKPPLLTKALLGEELYLYIAASSKEVVAVLIKEEDGMQKPIYYVSHALKDTNTRYPDVEKFVYAFWW